MTARSSTTSLALLLLAGCFAEPDLEIEVTRASQQTFELAVCSNVEVPATCRTYPVFPNKTTTVRNVYIFIEDDLPRIGLKLLQTNIADCVTVTLTGATVKRVLNISDSTVPPMWSEASEPVESCVP